VVNNDTDQVHARVYEELDIGEEQVSSNECWDVDGDAELEAPGEYDELVAPIHADLDLGNEQVSSNECYDVEDE
jgi:hypothetical protein